MESLLSQQGTTITPMDVRPSESKSVAEPKPTAEPKLFRPLALDDIPVLVEMAQATAAFKPIEIAALHCVFSDYFAEAKESGHQCWVRTEGSDPVGFVYLAPEEIAESAWTLWWIVVRVDRQGRGYGRDLLDFAEGVARSEGSRVMFIETSSLPHYEPTCRFYVKRGYECEGRIRDFYADQDDKLIYRKRLIDESPSA